MVTIDDIRYPIDKLAVAMEDRLREKDHHFPEGWKNDDPARLLMDGQKRLADAFHALLQYERTYDPAFLNTVKTKIVDSNNFGMMTIDRIGGFDTE